MDSRTMRPMLNNLTPLNEEREIGEIAVNRNSSSGFPLLNQIRYQVSTDEELVAKLRAGETEALTVLFERYSSLVFKIARRILRNDAEAEDAVQQVFLDLFRAVAKFDPAKGTFKVWLLMYAYHRALNHKRGLVVVRFYDLEDIEEVLRENLVGEKRSFPFQPTESAHLVREVLEQIQPRQREVIELVYYAGCTAEEIASLTGDTAAVVRHNLYRGMEKARSFLKKVNQWKDRTKRAAVKDNNE